VPLLHLLKLYLTALRIQQGMFPTNVQRFLRMGNEQALGTDGLSTHFTKIFLQRIMQRGLVWAFAHLDAHVTVSLVIEREFVETLSTAFAPVVGHFF
jgi:hypothetical protein